MVQNKEYFIHLKLKEVNLNPALHLLSSATLGGASNISGPQLEKAGL